MIVVTLVILTASPIDATFQGWAKKLPAPRTLSEMNGAGFSCPRHGGGTTLNHLGSLAKGLKLERDEQLLELVPWARNEDECLRHIAIEAILARLPGFDRNALSVPPMHDPEHFQFHAIMVALVAHLDAKKLPWSEKAFDGLLVKTSLADFPALAHGRWAEEIGPQQGFQALVELDPARVAVSSKHLPDVPKWPLHTWTSAVKTVTRDAKGVFTITCEWSQESNAKGYRGEKQTPAQNYRLWPVAPGIIWFQQGEEYWIKLKRE